MLQRCVHAFARGALPFRPVKSPLCSGLAGCCLCCARASAARSRLPRSGCTRSMRSSATLRELEEFRVDAVHIEILAYSKGPFGSQLFTLCARTLTHGSHGGGARTSICQTALQRAAAKSARTRRVHTQTATTLAGSPGILSRAHGGQLCAVSASCLSICSPQPRDACRSLRASARKEPQSHRKIDERMARWKPACGNKRVPWGEDRGKGSECRQW